MDNERPHALMRPAVLVGGAAILAAPFGFRDAWVAVWTTLLAVSTLAWLLLDRHREYRETISCWLGAPLALSGCCAAVLFEPMLGYHPAFDPPVAGALPGVAMLAALLWGAVRPIPERRLAVALGAALPLVALVLTIAPKGGREPWAAVGAMPVVTEFDASDVALVQLPDGLAFAGERLTTSRRRASDLPGIVLDTGIHGLTLCRPAAQREGVIPCSKRPLSEYLGASGHLQVRDLPDVWLVTDQLGSDLRRHPKYTHSFAFSKATLDPAPLHPWDLGVRLAAPARWSHVAAAGLVLSVLAAVYCLLRAARHRWMLHASAGSHLGEGVIALNEGTRTPMRRPRWATSRSSSRARRPRPIGKTRPSPACSPARRRRCVVAGSTASQVISPSAASWRSSRPRPCSSPSSCATRCCGERTSQGRRLGARPNYPPRDGLCGLCSFA